MPPVKSTFLARRACTINFGAVAHSPRQPPWPCNIDHLSRGETAPWPAHAYNRISAPHAFGPRTRPGNYFHSKLARNGTSNSGRNSWARHRPLAYQNAPSRALHGPGVACCPHIQPQQHSTHVLGHAHTHHGIPLHPKDARNGTSDSARNSRARHPTHPSKCTISSTIRARSGTPTPTT